MRKNGQISESFLLGAVLACVGGFLDAYTYICRGGVFANAQTGNIVFLGIRLAQGRPRACLKYLIPILAFVAGVVIAELVRHHFRDNTRLHWRQVIIAFEIVILAVVCFIPQRETCNLAANVLISFVCSLQVQGFRKMNGRTFSTTMCTGDLRSAAEFPRGANVNLCCLEGENRVRLLTFERGVEDFTLACGTGNGATAAALTLRGLVSGRQVELANDGGTLLVDITSENDKVEIFLTGPADFIFTGEIA